MKHGRSGLPTVYSMRFGVGAVGTTAPTDTRGVRGPVQLITLCPLLEPINMADKVMHQAVKFFRIMQSAF